MAARALAAAAAAVGGGRRMVSAGRTGPAPLLASSRNRYCSASAAQPAEDEDVVVDGAAMTTTGAPQVEAALNRKNVEELQGEEERLAATEKPKLGAGVLLEGDDASTWVPDQETGVFGPADADSGAPTTTHGGGGGAPPSATTFTGGSSVLDQTVFVREDDMEDVERPPMANANADASSSNK